MDCTGTTAYLELSSHFIIAILSYNSLISFFMFLFVSQSIT